jgi:hypothetical protein
MNGLKPICLLLRNHRFYEHETVVSAKAEAERLATTLEGITVVYVPVAIVTPPTRMRTTPVTHDPAQFKLAGLVGDDDDLPF